MVIENEKVIKKEFPKDFKGDKTETQQCFNCEEAKNILEFINIKIQDKTYHEGGWTYMRSARKGMVTRFRCNECNNPQVEFIRCNKCTELKHRDEYGKSARPTGKYVNCKPCAMSEWSKNRMNNLPAYRKNEKAREKRHILKNIPRDWAQTMVDNARARAKTKNILFEMTRDDIEKKILTNDRACEVTKIPFVHYRYATENKEVHHGQNKLNAFAPSLDRIIPEEGYTVENTRVVVNIYNNARGKAKDEHLLRLLQAVLTKEKKEVNEIEVNHLKETIRWNGNFSLEKHFGGKLAGFRNLYKDWRDFIDLDFEWYSGEIANNVCKITGIPYVINLGIDGVSEESDWSPSIDKINPYGGYLKKNCRVACTLYNRTKNIWTDKEVKKLAVEYLKHNSSGFSNSAFKIDDNSQLLF
jgi:hypothetical protein